MLAGAKGYACAKPADTDASSTDGDHSCQRRRCGSEASPFRAVSSVFDDSLATARPAPLLDLSLNVVHEHAPLHAHSTTSTKAQRTPNQRPVLRKIKTAPTLNRNRDGGVDDGFELGEPLLSPHKYDSYTYPQQPVVRDRQSSSSTQGATTGAGREHGTPLSALSMPRYLHMELASGSLPGTHMHRSKRQETPYESNAVKLERLQNFLLLPLTMEQVFLFGTAACLDAWLYSFTILPLRFLKAVYILAESWAINGAEYLATARRNAAAVFRRWRHPSRGCDDDSQHASSEDRRSLLIVCTCVLLLRLDASKTYHNIRGQAAIKLYVIFNVLEVADRLLSAIGQDVLECLFSREALERDHHGRSKVWRPLSLFLIALIYTFIHSSALFYQVITLNVAVNSYSNALITLLMSNQFVEIKSTVFKKFEKENLFQLTCADVVERFQLWLMLVIIASRNIVETGGFSAFGGLASSQVDNAIAPIAGVAAQPVAVRSSSAILPKAFTILPRLSSTLSHVQNIVPVALQVAGPFFVVLGSEMLVDWLKHAYINKFNNNRPIIYQRFLDVLAKDYYSNAFGNQNLTKRLGLPVIPLVCLFFRITMQTYHMLLTTWLPSSLNLEPSSTLSLTSIHERYSTLPQSAAASIVPVGLAPTLPVQLPQMFVAGYDAVQTSFRALISYITPSPALFVPIFTTIMLLVLYSALLLTKLVLGMVLLYYSRYRCEAMQAHERHLVRRPSVKSFHQQMPMASDPAVSSRTPVNAKHTYTIDGARRYGTYATVEMDDEKRRWINVDEPESRHRPPSEKDAGATRADGTLNSIRRYEMAAKRIW
ncbi:hypothetical protein KEM52_005328 [Ascosphaera acerosa]|nr:hypothetical protein KEM52_005328 [Ascosphaera acerosa]